MDVYNSDKFGNIRNEVMISQDHLSRGLCVGCQQWNKFGYRTSSAASSGDQTIWESNDDLVVMKTAETFTIAYNNTTDGSAGGANGAKAITFYYLDENEELQVALHTLGSSGSDVTSFSGLGINRAVVTGSGSFDTNENDITVTNTTSGNTQAVLPAGNGVTQQAVFFMPKSSTKVTAVGCAKFLFLAANKLSGSSPKVKFRGFVYNRFVDSKFEIFRYTMDTQSETHIEIADPCNFPISARDVLWFTMDTDQNNTVAECRFSLNLYYDPD